ncbi:MAG: ribosome maturation factor RimP [Acutalibacteraceae bacterium]
MELGATAARVYEIIRPFADELGLTVWDVRYVKEGSAWFLRIFIDKEGGVDITDCEALSRAVDQPLDEADPIKESYYLEVSSPGLGRELTQPEHFEMFLGEEITVRLIRPRDGQKEFVGVLKAYDGGCVTVQTDGGEMSFDRGEITRVKLNDDSDLF